MSSSDLAPDVRALLYGRIESYEQLELLLLLYRNAPESYALERISALLSLSPSETAEVLNALQMNGLVKVLEGAKPFAYAADTQSTDDAVQALAAAYATQKFEIIKFMSASAIRRVRNRALRAFADAFVIRKGKDDA